MKKEKGNILITVIFMMVMLLIIAIGITSVGSGGLENSVLSGNDIKSTENRESIGVMVQNGTNWATGEDNWINSADISGDIFGRNRLILRIFVEKNSKDIEFMLPDNMTSAGAVYVTAVYNDNGTNYNSGKLPNGFKISMVSGPCDINFNNNISFKNEAIAYKSDTAAVNGDYKLHVYNPDAGNSSGREYILFIRVFCKE